VVDALKDDPATTRIPVLVVTAKQITPNDRATLTAAVRNVLALKGPA
jgi:CheY-like chemotaxis protein